MRNRAFHQLLRKRAVPLNIGKLAKEVDLGRSHLTQVLHGERDGSRTWPKLASILTHEEYLCAHDYAQQIITGRNLIPGTPEGTPATFTLGRVVLRIPVVVVVRHLGIEAVQNQPEDIHLSLVERVDRVLS